MVIPSDRRWGTLVRLKTVERNAEDEVRTTLYLAGRARAAAFRRAMAPNMNLNLYIKEKPGHISSLSDD